MTKEFLDLLLDQAKRDAKNSKDDFVRGGICAIKQLWFDPAEEPKPGVDNHKELLVRSERGGLKVYPNPANGKQSWTFFCNTVRMISWAYADEFYPDENK